MGYITAEIVVDAFRHHFGVYGMTHVVASGAPTEQRFPPDLCLVNYREVSEQR